jgi:hypothetical protein
MAGPGAIANRSPSGSPSKSPQARRYVRVTSTADGELMPVEEPVKEQRARGGSASAAVAFGSHVVADAPGCGPCTWSPRDGWALKFVNQACVRHRDD